MSDRIERGPVVWSWQREAPLLAIVIGLFVISAVVWPFAEDRIPVHWNAAGEIDRYGGKVEGLLLIPVIALAVWALMAVIPRFDPGRRNYESFGAAYFWTRLGLLGFFALIHIGIVALALGAEFDIFIIFPLGTGALFILLGNLMPKFRPNFFAGIRTPWTLASARSWTATHRLGGRLFIVGGVLFALAGIIRIEWFIWVMLGSVFLGLAVLGVYSYRVWRDDPERVPVGMVTPTSED